MNADSRKWWITLLRKPSRQTKCIVFWSFWTGFCKNRICGIFRAVFLVAAVFGQAFARKICRPNRNGFIRMKTRMARLPFHKTPDQLDGFEEFQTA